MNLNQSQVTPLTRLPQSSKKHQAKKEEIAKAELAKKGVTKGGDTYNLYRSSFVGSNSGVYNASFQQVAPSPTPAVFPVPPASPYIRSPVPRASSLSTWMSCLDGNGNEYFFNCSTQDSSWDKPEDYLLPDGVTVVKTKWGPYRSDVVYGSVEKGKEHFFVPLRLRGQTELDWQNHKLCMRKQMEAVLQKAPYNYDKRLKLSERIKRLEGFVPAHIILQCRCINKATNKNAHYQGDKEEKDEDEEEDDDGDEEEDDDGDEEEDNYSKEWTNEELLEAHRIVMWSLNKGFMLAKPHFEKPPKHTKKPNRSRTSSPAGSRSSATHSRASSPAAASRTSSPAIGLDTIGVTSPPRSFDSRQSAGSVGRVPTPRNGAGRPPRTPRKSSHQSWPASRHTPPNSGGKRKREEERSPSSESATSRTSQQREGPVRRRQKVCHFFLKDSCQYGDNCRYFHNNGLGMDVRDTPHVDDNDDDDDDNNNSGR